MGVDFDAAFNRLNTNTTGDSASILDAEEVATAKQNSVWTVSEGMTSEQFKSANEHCATQDTDRDGTVIVSEQKAPIAEQLKNVWTSYIARFFKDDIGYNNSSATEAQQVTAQAAARAQNALNYIEYAKQNNIDIFTNNEGTGVDDEDGELQEYTNANGEKSTTTANPGVTSSKSNSNGIYTDTYGDGHTVTWNNNRLILSKTYKEGSFDVEQTNKYNEDGSYSYTKKYNDGESWTNVQVDKNSNYIKNTGFYTTARGNVKAYAQKGETADQTLTRLGITDPADRAAVMKANPKAAKNGYFRTDTNDVYIPKAVIDNMQRNNRLDEDKLAGKP